MNAPRHDADELRSALDALATAIDRNREIEAQISALRAQQHQVGTAEREARARAAKVLRREGGTVVHRGRSWNVDDNGCVTFQTVQVNLDAMNQVKAHNDTPLTLTPPASEKAA